MPARLASASHAAASCDIIRSSLPKEDRRIVYIGAMQDRIDAVARLRAVFTVNDAVFPHVPPVIVSISALKLLEVKVESDIIEHAEGGMMSVIDVQ